MSHKSVNREYSEWVFSVTASCPEQKKNQRNIKVPRISIKVPKTTWRHTKKPPDLYIYTSIKKLFKEVGMAVLKSMQTRVGIIQVQRWTLLFFLMPMKFHIKVKQKVGITFVLESSLHLFACFLVLTSLLPWNNFNSEQSKAIIAYYWTFHGRGRGGRRSQPISYLPNGWMSDNQT